MNTRIPLALLLAMAGCGLQEASLGTGGGLSSSQDPEKKTGESITGEGDQSSTESALTLSFNHQPLCDLNVADGFKRCHGRVRLDGQGQAFAASAPQGLTPSDLKAAYALPSSGGSGLTVAIVDAQDNPRAESDLAVYREQFGLPACTTANGCFKKVNQNGSTTSLPQADQGWAGEISLDLDMVSAACPNCKILLVEATSASDPDLGAAVNTAAQLGANAISNSYGGSESSEITSEESAYFDHPGVFITASTGDDGFGTEYPASSAHVTAVGGTSLQRSSSSSGRGWLETAWSGAGSGCSRYITKPSWQHDASCTKRMVADVSAVADPNTGVASYDSYGSGGWTVVGGTSAASPLIAGIFALTANSSQTSQFSYANGGDFNDITSGSNGSCSGATYECKAGAGYDGPTGNGTPIGSAMEGAQSGSGGGSAGAGGGSSASGGGGSGSTGGGSSASGGGSGSTGGGSSASGGGSGSTGGGSSASGGGSGSTGGGGQSGTGGGSATGGGSTGSNNTETEPNNSRSTANLLTANVTMVGSISSGSDVDYFRISVTPGSNIDLSLTNLDADCDLRIYSSSGALLAISDRNGTTSEEIGGTVANSIYYAKVNGYDGATCDGYRLTLTVQ